MNKSVFPARTCYIFFFLLGFGGSGYSHQVVYEAKEARTVTVKIGYDDGTIMSYAEVDIFAPGE